MKFDLKTDKDIEIRNYYSMNRISTKGDCFENGGSSSLITEDICLTVENAKSESDRIFFVQKLNKKKDGSRFCSNPVENFFIKSAEPMQKLNVMLSGDGKIRKIINLDEIKKKWRNTKIYLENVFVGQDEEVMSVLQNWIVSLDDFYNDDETILNSIPRDLFYDFFFLGYWNDYGSDGILKRQHRFSNLIGNVELTFDERLTIEMENGKRSISLNGLLNKESSDLKSFETFANLSSFKEEDLFIHMFGKYLFDEVGLPERLELFVEAKLRNSDFEKKIGCVFYKK